MPIRAGRQWRFTVIVPAHNEAERIASCVESLRAAPFSPEPEVLVVADNCTDDTAARARQAGATAIERTSACERGKSYALQLALGMLSARPGPPDAVIVVDGDSHVSPDFFAAMAARLDAGAEVVQVHYAADDAPGTLPALRRLALGLVHWARPLGAARLGLGTSLKGNGMAFRFPAARGALHANGLAEDAVASLGLAAMGMPVAFEPRATLWGPMAASYREARTQDRRWEGGRMGLVPRGLAVALRSVLRGRFAAAHTAVECASLPLSLVTALAGSSLALALAGFGSLPLAIAAAGSLVTYVVIGLAAVRPPLRDVLALRAAPRFFVYKLGVLVGLARRRQATWERTSR